MTTCFVESEKEQEFNVETCDIVIYNNIYLVLVPVLGTGLL